MNQPIKHHYIPVFYLNRWKNDTGNIFRYKRDRNGNIESRSIYPKGTAFELDLYSFTTTSTEYKRLLESDIFSKLDNDAAKCLEKIEKTGINNFSSIERNAWAKFINSLYIRHPDDLDQMVKLTRELLLQPDSLLERKIKEESLSSSEYDLSKSFSENMKLIHSDDDITDLALTMSVRLIVQGYNVNILSGLNWAIREFKNVECFFTSDRPYIQTSPFQDPFSSVYVPIGPKKLFIAARRKEVVKSLLRCSEVKLYNLVNDCIITKSKNYCYDNNGNRSYMLEQKMSSNSNTILRSMVESLNR